MTTVRAYLALAAIGLASTGCGGGSKASGTTSSGLSGIAVPQEISALPTSTAIASLKTVPLEAVSTSALSADSDYERAKTFKFVDERSLNQFSILNTIFKAVSQTHYADAENVGAEPYGAMVSWTEDKGDSQMKMIKSWVVESDIIVENGQNVNRVQAWMRNMMDGDKSDGMTPPAVIKADLKISEAPTQRADGSYSDYGVWTLNVNFADNNPEFFFAASATHTADGVSVVMLNQHFPGEAVRGILHKSDTQGFGKVQYPDWKSCHEDQCTPQKVTVAYVYDADHVAVKKDDLDPVYKDRSNVVDLVNRYGLFDAETGDDISRTHSFGFPIRFEVEGENQFGYYGAWQGRHQVWTQNQKSLAAGTTVTRGDRGPNQAGPSYTVSEAFTGTLVKRTLVEANIMDVKDLVVETWIGEGFSLRYDGSKWNRCTFNMEGPPGPECSTEFTDFAKLAYNPNDTRRNVFINLQPQGPMAPGEKPQLLLYRLAGDWGLEGFYLAESNLSGPPQPTDTPYPPELDAQIWVNINGAIYISFNGTSWVQKTLLSFDQTTYTPTFEVGDSPYTLDLYREYYINNQGGNYIVKYDGSDYDVKIELQSVANPVNVATFLSGVSYFKPQWCGSDCSTYQFITDSSKDNFLKLVYKDVGDQDSSATPGDVVENGMWGLMAYDSTDTSMNLQFNWDYPQGEGNCGVQQFLMNDSGDYVMLDDPIRLAAVTLTNHHGDEKKFSLQFDGSWVSGLPDIFRELQQNDWAFTDEIAAKVVAIPSGTEVTNASDDSKHYLFKQLQVNEFLAIIDDPGNLDLTEASALDLSAVPDFVANGMGTIPDVTVKYSEGVLVP